MSLPQENQRYTYADYCTWDDGQRWELIDGVPYAMSPAPRWEHQEILVELSGQFHNFLKGKPCKVFVAPFDVQLNANNDKNDTVVQPDLIVICDYYKLGGTGCKGAPDLVIEILSPSTATHDKWVKFNLYQRSGVREYWIVDPDSKTVSVHVLKDGIYTAAAYGVTDNAPVSVLPGCEINLQDVFDVE